MSTDPASVATPLMTRTVCTACGHMHRRALTDKCGCCASDVRRNSVDEPVTS